MNKREYRRFHTYLRDRIAWDCVRTGNFLIWIIMTAPNIESSTREERLDYVLNEWGCQYNCEPIQRTIKKDIADLQAKGILTREGGRKDGRWVITNNKDNKE